MLSADNPLVLLGLFLGGYGLMVWLVYRWWSWRYPSAGRYREIIGDRAEAQLYTAQEFRERAIIIDNVREINREKLRK